MKKLSYIFLALIFILLCSCKAKGGKINPLDTNTFDPVAVGGPLVVDTDIVGVSDTSTTGPSPYDKADSMVEKDIDSTRYTDSVAVDTSATSLP